MSYKRVYYIWCDESEQHGAFYSNFYGGILVKSSDYKYVMKKMSKTIEELHLENEIKWQNVNAVKLDAYMRVVDMLFDLMAKHKVKIRIFFRHNKNVPVKNEEGSNKHIEYFKLYYQFIKHSFGLQYSNNTYTRIDVHLMLDDIPMDGKPKEDFKNFLVGLSNDEEFRNANIVIKRENISEVDSKKHLPLQVMDLILGSMDFRLNNKHKEKQSTSNRRGKRTVAKEKLYKHINAHIRTLRPGFNVGVSTSITNKSDRWTDPYRHWSFVPSMCFVDETKSKHYNKKN